MAGPCARCSWRKKACDYKSDVAGNSHHVGEEFPEQRAIEGVDLLSLRHTPRARATSLVAFVALRHARQLVAHKIDHVLELKHRPSWIR